MQRVEAKLPPYIFPGPYQITRRQTREVKAELERRMLVYAWDERRKRQEKKRRMRVKQKWGVYKMPRLDGGATPAIDKLPSYHALNNAQK